MIKLPLMTCLIFVILAVAAPATADEADAVFVELVESGGYYGISVTLRHADTGWDHYADWWRVRTEDGRELARRTLAHPHVNEQPFERALLKSVKIPQGVKVIIVEGHDLIHGYGGKSIRIDLSKDKGDGYSINRR